MTEDVTKKEEKKEEKKTAPGSIKLATHLINEESLRTSISRLLPVGDVTLDQFCAYSAQYLVQKSDSSVHGNLSQCSYDDLVSCIFEGARWGLIIGGTFSHADIIVRNYKPKLELGMHGIRELSFRSGLIKAMEGSVVYEGDTFKCNLGDLHNPVFHGVSLSRNSTKALGIYILVSYTNGITKAHVMGEPEMNSLQQEMKTKSTDKAWPYSPWNRFLSQMCMKTLLKRAGKQIPFKANSALHAALDYETDDHEETTSVVKKNSDKRKDPLEFINEVTDLKKEENVDQDGVVREENEDVGLT